MEETLTLDKAQEEIKKTMNSKVSEVEKKLSESNKTAIEKAKKEITDKSASKSEYDKLVKKVSNLTEVVEKQGEIIKQGKMGGNNQKSFRQKLGEALDKAVKENHIGEKGATRTQTSVEIVIKDDASDTHTVGDVAPDVYPAGSTANVTGEFLLLNAGQRLEGLWGAPIPTNNILNYIPVGTLAGRILYGNVIGNTEGDAEFVPECGIKPIVKTDLATKKVEAGKVAIRIRLSEEYLTYIWAVVDNELIPRYQQQLMDKLAKAVLEGLPEFKGILENASAYTPIPSHQIFTAPNNLDALAVAVNQLEVMEWTPAIIVVNPSDRISLTNIKGNDNHYSVFNNGSIQLVRDLSGNSVVSYVGARPIPILFSNAVAPDHVLIASLEAFQVSIGDELIMRMSNSDKDGDFSRNIWTILLERFMADFAPEETGSGILYDTFANIKTAITA